MYEQLKMLTDTKISRRSVLTGAAFGAASLALRPCLFADTPKPNLSITGEHNPDLASFDSLMSTFVENNKVPGASLAVTHHGKLVYARGFGLADVEQKHPVQPNSLFRIASVSKPITAVAILQLVEKNKIKLDDRVTERMNLNPLAVAGTKLDQRWKQVTIHQCLQHTGGWDRDKSFDPIGRPWEIARTLHINTPVSAEQVVQYMMGQPLDFNPGERHAYSNLGYLVLGRIIEAASGHKYEDYIKKEVLGPLGIKNAQLGKATIDRRLPGEVTYYDPKHRTGSCLYPPHVDQKVPIQYGAENFEAFEAHGGWVATAIELVRFASAFDNPTASRLLHARSIETMFARPPGLAGHDKGGKPKDAYYGCGWQVRPIGNTGKANTWHMGYIAGSEAILVRRNDGLNWAVLFNTANNPKGKALAGLIDGRVHEAADKVKTWPNHDQFEKLLK
jgi:N-acyl-D-amino-acid deacylase